LSHFRKLLYAHAEHTRKRFYRMLIILGTEFIAHWAYEERNSAHAQPAVKCELFYMYNLCWAYAERILSHTEHTQNEFHHMLSILGTDFIACWACAEMFKSRISLPIRIRFLKISCYRPLGPNGFGFCKKSIKKIHACVPLRRWDMPVLLVCLFFTIAILENRQVDWQIRSTISITFLNFWSGSYLLPMN
jgi:hypothetical protein